MVFIHQDALSLQHAVINVLFNSSGHTEGPHPFLSNEIEALMRELQLL